MKTLQLFGLTPYPYGLSISVGALCGVGMMAAWAPRRGLPRQAALVVGALGVPLGIVGARLLFCALHIPLFFETYENPWLMLRFWDGGLSMTGLLLGLGVAAWLAARLMGHPAGRVMDLLALPMGLVIAACRWGERFTELGIGKLIEENPLIQTLPWLVQQETMGIATEYRLAVSQYEWVVALMLFAGMLALCRWAWQRPGIPAGDTALLFLACYGATQMLLESLRDDGHMLLIFLRFAQVAAALGPVVATGVFARRYARARGGGGLPVALCWGGECLALALGVLVEFSLDGRLTWGVPTLLRDYLLLAGASVLLLAPPLWLFKRLCTEVYAAPVAGGKGA